MELVDAAVPPSVLMPIKQTITEVEGVKVDLRFFSCLWYTLEV